MKKLLSVALLTTSFAQPVLCMENNNNNKESKIVLSPEEQESLNKQLFEVIEKKENKTILNEAAELFNQGADVNARDTYNRTPLHRACSHNNLALIKLLLNKNADVNTKNMINETPLHAVCYTNEPELAQLLVNKGANIHVKDNYNRTPLNVVACFFGDKKLMLILLKSLIKPTLDWNQKRLALIGHYEKNCLFSTLPIEMIHYIFSFCGNKKQNIAQLKKIIDLSNIKTSWIGSDELISILPIVDPQSWADEKTAEQTYQQLVTLIKESEALEKENNNQNS